MRSSGLGVLELEDAALARRVVAEQTRLAVEHDRAEVVVLGCGGMAGLDERLSADLGVPVVEGVTAAVKLAEGLHDLHLTTSTPPSPQAHHRLSAVGPLNPVPPTTPSEEHP